MIIRLTRSFMVLGCSLGIAALASGQPQVETGFYYPVQPRDGYIAGYHMLAGLLPISSAYGGHFMSPSNQRTDPQTGRPGKYLTDLYHNGYDVMADYGQPVFPISGGTVKEISEGGWSNGGTTNVAIILAHSTSTGQQFRALYGHIEKATLNPLVKNGVWVPAGTVMGKVGTWVGGNHLHFGINVIDMNTPLPYKGQDLNTPLASIIGYGHIGINYWQGTWPDRKSWVDPIFFIETNSPSAVVNTNDLVAKSDMKQYLVARVDSALVTDSVNFGFISQDQYFEYRYEWFYKLVGGQWHYVLANHATYIYNRSTRYVIYKDWDTQQVFGWFQVVVLP
jgi:murein DD-endopeptidase MepM/ murein hydrolase activator NlpD